MASRRKNVNASRSTALPAVGDVNAVVRARQALLMAIEGHTYEAIAAACGYKDRSGSYRAVQRELARFRRPEIAEALALELMRLDAYLTVYAPKAMAGDGWSLDRCMRIGERRAKLLGMEWAARPHESAQDQQRMYLIGCHDDGTLPPFPPDVPQPRPGDHVMAVPQSVLDAMS